MTTTPTSTSPALATPAPSPALRRLYLARFGFAFLWAGLFALASSPYSMAALALAVIYPAFDVAAVAVDARSAAGTGRSRATLYLNMLISAVAAVGLAFVGTGDASNVLAVWGAWAIASGAIQLVVGLQRRGQTGQRPMIISGGLSVVAGTFFAASAGNATSVSSIAGYAAVGGVFFLVSALRLSRPTQRTLEAG